VNHKIANENKPEIPEKPKYFLAGIWLIAAIPVAMAVLLPIDRVLDLGEFDDPRVFLFLGIVHFSAGYLWSRSLSCRSGLIDNIWMNVAGGVAFALLVPGMIVWVSSASNNFFDSLIDVFSVRGVAHLEWAVVFVTWVAIITGGCGLALGLGLRDLKLALRLLVFGFVVGSASFLLVAFIGDVAGFRIGTPNQVEMLPTTFLGTWTAAFFGSEVFGRVLASWSHEKQSVVAVQV
jgi:hypothetical protein